MKNGPLQRLKAFFSGEFEDVAKTVGLSLNDFVRMARRRELSDEVFTKLEMHYGLRKDYVLTGEEPAVIEKPLVRLLQLREELGLSQQEFAKTIGLTQGGLSGVEGGRIPLRRIMALAVEAVHGIRHQWLLYNDLPQKKDRISLNDDEKRCLDRLRSMNKETRQAFFLILSNIESQGKRES